MKRHHYTLLLVVIFILVYFLRRPRTEQQPQPPNPTTQPQSQPQKANTIPAATGPQNFDYYLLNLSWSPEFCHSHQTAPECARFMSGIRVPRPITQPHLYSLLFTL
jgi:ribonuclease T2